MAVSFVTNVLSAHGTHKYYTTLNSKLYSSCICLYTYFALRESAHCLWIVPHLRLNPSFNSLSFSHSLLYFSIFRPHLVPSIVSVSKYLKELLFWIEIAMLFHWLESTAWRVCKMSLYMLPLPCYTSFDCGKLDCYINSHNGAALCHSFA